MQIYHISGYDFIKNGKLISDKIPDGEENDTWIYNRIDNTLLIETDYEKYKDTLKYSNMGKNFLIYTGNGIIHANTGIQLDMQNNLPEDTKLIADTVKNGNLYDKAVQSIGQEYKNLNVYDISLKDEKNVKIQPSGNVKMYIPIKDNMDTSKLSVYRVENNGNKIQYDVTVTEENGINYATFETNHFSIYVLAEKNTTNTKENDEEKTEQVLQEEQKKQDTPKHKLDNEPKTGITSNIVTITVISLSIIGIVICKKRMYN